MTGAVFVLNAGSSSLKYQLVDPDSGDVHAAGTVERIGEEGGVPDHEAAVRQALAAIDGKPEPDAVGHRVVHGGDRFDAATVVTPEVERAIDELAALAPLHNPANLQGIRAAQAVLDVPQVAVFDTAFHRTIPASAATYAIPADLAREHQVRRYGFHGTSHQYVSRAAAAFLGVPLEASRIIVLHLGNGASACAVRGGRSVDTSMGMTPLEGLVMGTRSGDIDPAAIFHLHRQAGLGFEELEQLLNRESGLKGLTGRGDMRDVQAAAAEGDEAAEAALAVYRHRLRHYIGAYLAELGGLDALVFTAGVGENNSLLRRRTLEPLGHLGLQVDPDRNEVASKAARRISPDDAPVAVLVVPTNEELEIARQTAAVV
ncbi:acetate/propionate family kinase [Amnibacterium kyonggiense]|uniref:Acetate kinase n=1 Tax=Amnibacterium kyonggiense TaxID=595671 RepID=A0A4R7FL38_9MICO|nr:acetate kinase [Amnibacterium kyonggiense]TDS77093.1 acetate kinase [Amnibacterium kyonggiense]